jgi:DNA-binding MarR family transcriptional regulator
MHATVARAQTLAEDLNAFWILIQRTSSSQWFREIAEADLSLTQLKTLMALGSDADQRLSVKQLAGFLHLSEAATSRAADAMVRRGLLARTECAEDRRQRLLQLTPAGAALRDRVIEARVAGLVEFVEGLEPAEQQALAAALSPIVQRLQT